MKKELIVFGLVLVVGLIGLAVFVSAWSIEYVAPIYKGWNLVYSFMNPDQLEGQGFESKNIKAVYGFLPNTQEYVRFYPNPDMNKINQMDGDQLRNTAFWVYSNSETGETFNGLYNGIEYWLYGDPIDLIPYNERQMYKGWNFVGITSDMIGKSVREIKGDCNILNAYIWNSQYQKWEEKNLITGAYFPQDLIGTGIVIKVSSDCRLGDSSGTTSPPSLPSPSPSQDPDDECTDSDKGLNYNIRGVLSVGGKNYEDKCMDSSFVTEYFCDNPPTYYDNYYCPNGCSNGACN